MVSARPGRVISVGGGKGGVGKSVVAANLAVAMAQLGARVVLVDADLGSPNQHTLFGLTRPGPGVEAFLAGRLEDLGAAAVEVGVPNLRLVPGNGGVVGTANLPSTRKQKLLRHVLALPADVVVVDVGAGVSFNVLDLFDAADLRLVVMTPQLTSAQNAYAFMKSAVFRELRRLAAATGQQALVDEADEGAEPTGSAAQLLARLASSSPALAATLQAGLAAFGARLLGNQLFEPREVNVIYAISRMARDYLGLEVPVLGSLRASRRMHDSVDGGRPYLLHAGVDGDECAASLRAIAGALLDAPLPRLQPAPRPGAGEGSGAPPAHRLAEAGASLPVAVSAYERACHRHPVNVTVTLVHPGGVLTAQVRDVSEGGALLELDRPPPAGTRLTMVFTSLDDQPSLACVVRHASAASRRAGVEFVADPEAARRAAAGLRREGALAEVMDGATPAA